VEIKELFGASIVVLELACHRELVVLRDLLLQGDSEVALRLEEDVSDCFVPGVFLELNFREADFLLESPEAGAFCALLFLRQP
jgi:hypothetical protein